MQNVQPGDVVTFTQYQEAPLSGRRRMTQRMENMVVAAVIAPGEVLPRECIDECFGEDLDDRERRALAVSPAARLILKDDEDAFWCVSLAEDFLRTGLQKIEIGTRAAPAGQQGEPPSYLAFMNAFAAPADTGFGENAAGGG